VDLRVLRRFHDGDREYVEIIHDVLAPVIHEKRNRRSKKTKNMIIGILSLLLLCFALLTTFAFYQMHRADEENKRSKIMRITAEALLELPRDNTKAIRMAEAAYRMGLPDPPARTFQALSKAGYSSFKEPFYKVSLEHQGAVTSAVFSPDGTRILTASRDGTAKVWYTPEAIYEWLKTAPIAPLSPEEKKELDIQ
jgi:WD40 repeat protein